MYQLINKTDSYMEFQDGEKKVLTPVTQSIIVKDENNVNVLKSMQCRKNILTFTEE